MNFEFLLVLNHDDVNWDCPKKEDLGKRRIVLKHIIFGKGRIVLKHTIFGKSGRSCRYFVVENYIFCFDIP